MQFNTKNLQNKIVLVTGHFGAGKTNFACNLAAELKKTSENVFLIDYDTVNPYYRAADFKHEADRLGIKLIASEFANTNVDIPAVPPQIRTALLEAKSGADVIFDVGGDMLGAAALGFFGRELRGEGYEMLYVFNACRPLTQTPEEAYQIMLEIEQRCGLKTTTLVNNTNLGELTDAELINSSLEYARRLSELSSLPILCTCADYETRGGEISEKYPVFRIHNITNYPYGR